MNSREMAQGEVMHYAISAAFVAGVTCISWLLNAVLDFEAPHSLNFLFAMPVFFSAVYYRLPVAIFAVVLSILAYDMIITPPLWHVQPWKVENVVNFLVMILTTVSVASVRKIRLLESQNQQLEEEQKRAFLSAMLSSISHDFKTPLVTVIGALSSLKAMRTYDNEVHCRQLVGGALEEAEKLNRFISNLVEINRLESGLNIVHREPASLRDLLASPLKSLRHLVADQKIHMEIEKDFPLLNVNQPLMELVFLNLLENALKYGGGPAGTISITAALDGHGAVIDIADDGPGIPEEERQAVFMKFYRSEEGDRKLGGTGLGLYICSGILEAHGGGISVADSKSRSGACLRIRLPVAALVSASLGEESEVA